MAVNERARHSLYEAVRDVLGDEPAETLMEMLPPVGWADVATKHDVVLVRDDVFALRAEVTAIKTEVAAIKADVAAIKADVAELRGFVHGEINKLILWFVPFNIGVAFAAARLG